jgi:ankyrin repeat protein
VPSIWTAAGRGHVDQVLALLSADATAVNATDSAGLIALHHACDQGRLPVVRLLLEKKALINAQVCWLRASSLMARIPLIGLGLLPGR